MPLQLLTLMMSEPLWCLSVLLLTGIFAQKELIYAMICEIDATACKVTFHVTDDVA